jgi:hypothetical protein
MYRTRHETLIGTHRLSLSALAIWRQLRLVWTNGFPFKSCVGNVRGLIGDEQAYRTGHYISLAPLDNLLERL